MHRRSAQRARPPDALADAPIGPPTAWRHKGGTRAGGPAKRESLEHVARAGIVEPATRLSYRRAVTIGASLFLIAVGAILKFAVTADVAGIDLQTVGVILMIVGGVGLVLGLVLVLTSDRREPPPPGY
jgi:Domain of unknown function (DUF6458)